MKTLLLIFLLTSISYAQDYISGISSTGYIYGKVETPTEINFSRTYFSNLQVNYKYYNQGVNILISPYMYYAYSKSPIYCIGTQTEYNKYGLFLRSSYISYTYDNHTIGYGILPFSNGINAKYNFDYIKDGEGISILNNITLEGIFYKYKFNDSILKAIFGKIPKEKIAGIYIPNFLQDKTKVFLLDYEFNYFGVKYNVEYTHTFLYFKSEKIAGADLLGLNLQKENIEDLDLDIYGSIGISRFNNKNVGHERLMLDEMNIPNYMPVLFPDGFSFNNNTYFGSAVFFGIRKNYNIFSKDVYINYEHFHSFGDWFSNNSGNLYNTGKITDSYSINYSDFIKFGVLLNNKSEVGVSVIKIKRDNLKFGSPERGNFVFSNHIKELGSFRIVYKLRF